MATGGKDRESRAARERARIYRARQDFHASVKRRRTRDNVIAGVAGGAIVLAAIGAQIAYFTAGPGAPAPASPSPTATVESTPDSSLSPAPSVSPDPTGSAPAATPTP